MGAVLPHPDPNDRDTMIAGVRKRVARRPPEPSLPLLTRLDSFVQRFVEKHLVPLSADTDISVDTWLAGTNYPEWRKEELRAKWEEVRDIEDHAWYTRVKCFQKDEPYPEYKHARGIYARVDEFKCFVGPYFKNIETEVYKLHWFIKHVPVADRPRYITELLSIAGAKYLATDYTAFESLFRAEVMMSCEFVLYTYMLQHLPTFSKMLWAMYEVLGASNTCTFKEFVLKIVATRMSGEMCTSLGNGFSNLMFMLFTCEENGVLWVDGVVEGDDGLFAITGTPPTSDDFARLGLNIKLEVHDKIQSASFCGIIFDEEDLVNVTDPMSVLVGFGWSNRAYVNSRPSKLRNLLECKALSLVYEYPGCPVVASLARYVLRNIKSGSRLVSFVKNWKGFNTYERTTLLEAVASRREVGFNHRLYRDTPVRTRFLVEEKFGLPVSDQLAIESYLDSLQRLQPLDSSYILDNCRKVWCDCYEMYVHDIRSAQELQYPHLRWPTRAGFKKEW